MQTYLECYPCVLRQAIEAAKMAQASPSQQRTIVNLTLKILSELPDDVTPPEIGAQVHQIVRKITSHPDPYASVKQEATTMALALLPRLRAMIQSAPDQLEAAIRLSIAGNVIDFGPQPDYDLWQEVERVMVQDLAIDDLQLLREHLRTAQSILLIGDNAGETVFDRLLIEALSKPVTYVVRGGPVLNDATHEDAIAAGIDEVAEIIDQGNRLPGIVLDISPIAFQARFRAADLILSKGMGNYETLSEVPAPIFFLLKVKCPVISRDIGAPVGSIIVKRGLDPQQ
jgi:uncharacterized protein with ATP-grasp and redox domains